MGGFFMLNADHSALVYFLFLILYFLYLMYFIYLLRFVFLKLILFGSYLWD